MPIPNHTLARACGALQAVLPKTVELRTPDRHGRVQLGSVKPHILWIGEGNLRDARDLINATDSHPCIAAARRMSPGARQVLSQAGVGWVDEEGNAEIAFGSVLVSRMAPAQTRAAPAPRWTQSALAVAEALLLGTRATVSATQTATGLSAGSCTAALQALGSLGHLTARAKRGRQSARSIRDFDDLLRSYAVAARAQRSETNVAVGITWQDPLVGLVDFGKTCARAGIDWSATGAAASLVLAPHLTNVSAVEIYIDASTPAELQAAARALGLRLISGGRLTLRPYPTVTTRQMSTSQAGLRTAPWPRVFADLECAGVRGETAAEHLLEVVRER